MAGYPPRPLDSAKVVAVPTGFFTADPAYSVREMTVIRLDRLRRAGRGGI